MDKPLSIDQYEDIWWVHLGRRLHLTRFDSFVIDASPQECLEYIHRLKEHPLRGTLGTEVATDTLKRPYRFFCIPLRNTKTARLAYITGRCEAKEGQTIVDIETLPISNGTFVVVFIVLLFGYMVFKVGSLILETLPRVSAGQLILFFWACFMVLFPFIALFWNRYEATTRFREYMMAFQPTLHLQDEEQSNIDDEDAPHQDLMQGHPER